MGKFSLKIAVIAGEESGDLLGADLISSLSSQEACNIRLIGVGGRHLEGLGLKSVFNSSEISLIGLGAVLKRLPILLMHIRSLSRFIARENPHCLIIIDNPDFAHRVAKRVRILAPSIPIIQYVAPTVWAWRPDRARAMCKFVDHVLAVFPFEEEIMKNLGGPPTTYVGHRLSSYAPLLKIQSKRKNSTTKKDFSFTMVILPGSRRSEVRHLMPIFEKVIKILRQRVPHLRIILPTLPHLVDDIHSFVQNWEDKIDVVVGENAKWCAFSESDVALAALGTVSLELALAKIPMVLCYKLDLFSKLFIFPKLMLWSAALPNIILDKPIVPEYLNEFLRPGMLARQIEQLLYNSSLRQLQLSSFDIVKEKMEVEIPPGIRASQVIMDLFRKKRNTKDYPRSDTSS
ncbi:lipid-A-disaccharide synthase [Bartonella ancashensis]|uniref:Lipid-A-disaccharide synthase n=1 Tax=Bartonella ancashensis TaxID=1318743 RepID=A0A0M4M452_9HYPH|nr:lipid-A-disaccharide synthase [Bartonella ancashensis]ALE03887.1 Lipid-A-disaccharide synthase [Bartonella ancashensis]